MVFAALLTVMMSCETDTSGEVKECAHEFSDPTCEAPKTCKKCGVTEGDVVAHTIEDGKCPTCGKGIFDVMVLWDEEPGKASNSDPVYDYYKKDSQTMNFYGEAYSIDPVKTKFGDTVNGTVIGGGLVISKTGIESNTYDWEIIIQKYYVEGNSYDKFIVKGSVRAAEFSKDSTLVIDSWEKIYGYTELTDEMVNEYVSTYGASLMDRAITGDLKTFLRENGEDVELLGFDNYAN